MSPVVLSFPVASPPFLSLPSEGWPSFSSPVSEHKNRLNGLKCPSVAFDFFGSYWSLPIPFSPSLVPPQCLRPTSPPKVSLLTVESLPEVNSIVRLKDVTWDPVCAFVSLFLFPPLLCPQRGGGCISTRTVRLVFVVFLFFALPSDLSFDLLKLVLPRQVVISPCFIPASWSKS